MNWLTYWFHRLETTLEKVEPEEKLSELNVLRVVEAEDDNVDTIRVADEVIVQQVVWLVTRELPDAQVASICNAEK